MSRLEGWGFQRALQERCLGRCPFPGFGDSNLMFDCLEQWVWCSVKLLGTMVQNAGLDVACQII
eukprot:4042449-Amphidinium_carterae.1